MVMICAFTAAAQTGQVQSIKEYVHLGGRTIAIENSAAVSTGPFTVSPPPMTITPNSEQMYTFTAHPPIGATGFNSVYLQFHVPPTPGDGSGVPSNACYVVVNLPLTGYTGSLQVFTDSGAPSANLWPPNDWTADSARTNSQCKIGKEHLISIVNLANGDAQVQIPITFYALNSYHLYMAANYHTTPVGSTTPDFHSLLTNGHEWVDMGTYPVGTTTGSFTVSATTNPLVIPQGGSGGTQVVVTSTGGFSQPVAVTALATPSTISCAANPPSTTPTAGTPGSTTLTCSVPSSVPANNTYPVTVTGTSGSIVNNTTLNIQVSAPVPPGPYTVDGPTPIPANSEQTFTFTGHLPVGATGFNSFYLQFHAPPTPADGSPVPANACYVLVNLPFPGYTGSLQVFTDTGAWSANLWPPDDWTTDTVRTNSQCKIGKEDSIHFSTLANGDVQVQIPITFYALNSYHLYMAANYRTTPPGSNNPDFHALLTNGHEWADMGAYTVTSGGAGTNLYSAIFGTGVSGYSGTVPQSSTPGAADSHWKLVSQPAGAACTGSITTYVGTTPSSAWTAGATGAQWISPNANASLTCPPGTYVYEQTVDLTGYTLNGATVNGWFGGDDEVTLKLIHRVGTDTVVSQFAGTSYYCPSLQNFGAGTHAAFCGFTPFSIPGTSFSPNATNVLSLEVSNTVASTGAYLEINPTSLPSGSLALSTSAPSILLTQGGTAVPLTLTFTPSGGFRGAASTGFVPNMPSGVTVAPSPVPPLYIGTVAVQEALSFQASASATLTNNLAFSITGSPAASAPMSLTVQASGSNGFHVSPNSATISGGAGQSAVFSVTGASTWTVPAIPTQAASWLQITRPAPLANGTANGTNNDSIIYTTTSANCTGSDRTTGQMLITSGALTQPVTITQSSNSQVTQLSPAEVTLFWGVSQQYTALAGSVDVTSQVVWKVELQSGSSPFTYSLDQTLTDAMNQSRGNITAPAAQTSTYRITASLNATCGGATALLHVNWFIPPQGLLSTGIFPINGSSSSPLEATGWGAQVGFQDNAQPSQLTPWLNLVLDPIQDPSAGSINFANACALQVGVTNAHEIAFYDDAGNPNSYQAAFTSCQGSLCPRPNVQPDAVMAVAMPSNLRCRTDVRLNSVSTGSTSPVQVNWYMGMLFNAGYYGRTLSVWAQEVHSDNTHGPWQNYYQFIVPPAQAPDGYLDVPTDPIMNPPPTAGSITISGWAIDNKIRPESPITAVKIYVDGVFIGNAGLGGSRPDVCSSNPQRWPYSINCPNVGFSMPWNSTSVANGVHTMRVDIYDSDTPTAHVTSITRQFNVQN